MKNGLLAAALLLLPSVAMATTPPVGEEHMHFELLGVGNTATFSAEWIRTLPQIAKDCDMKVVAAQLQNVASRFSEGHRVEFLVNALPYDDITMLNDWHVMVVTEKEKSCALAESLWGEDGEMFPGVLRKL